MSCCASLYACAVAISSSFVRCVDLVLERALVVGDLRLRFAQLLRHVVERVGQKAQFVGRMRRHIHVEASGADRARRAHQPVHRRHEPPREQQRGDDREHQQREHDGDRADHLLAEEAALHFLRHAEAQIAQRRILGLRRRSRHLGRLARERGGRPARSAHDGDELDVALAAERDLVIGDAAGQARRLRKLERRQLRVAKSGAEAAFDEQLTLGVENAGVRDVRIVADAIQHLLEIRLVRREEAVFRELRHDAEHRGALVPQLLLVVAPLLREVEHRQRNRREEDQADRQQVELGEQAHPHRRQIRASSPYRRRAETGGGAGD